jgi:NADPH:quinone reductase
MRAVWYERQGPAREVLTLGEMPTPQAGRGEVRVKLKASGCNPADTYRRGGRGHPMDFPRVVTHSDGAGVVDQVGPGVPRHWLGQRVWIYNGQRLGRAFGTAAEWIALDVDLVRPLSDNTPFEAGACLGIPAMTAHVCVFCDGPVTGKTVLVTGAAGAVGHYAAQMAKLGGATVIATVSSAEKAKHAEAAGADFVVNYRTENVAERIMALTERYGVDRVVDVELGGNLPTSLKVLRPHGTVIGYATTAEPNPRLPFRELMFKCQVVKGMALPNTPHAQRRAAQDDITRWCAEGRLVHTVAGPWPLAETVTAHEVVEQGGKHGTAVVLPDR